LYVLGVEVAFILNDERRKGICQKNPKPASCGVVAMGTLEIWHRKLGLVEIFEGNTPNKSNKVRSSAKPNT
jgi:hypothetical protein